jgi:hypothetical protein
MAGGATIEVHVVGPGNRFNGLSAEWKRQARPASSRRPLFSNKTRHCTVAIFLNLHRVRLKRHRIDEHDSFRGTLGSISLFLIAFVDCWQLVCLSKLN